jgi:DNA-binding transcriptional LysR family regulator
MTVMARFAAAGHGITILPQAILRADIRTGVLRVLSTRPRLRPRTLSACYLMDKRHVTMRAIIDAAARIMRKNRLIRGGAR